MILELNSYDVNEEYNFAVAMESMRTLLLLLFLEDLVLLQNLNRFIVIKELLQEGIEAHFLELFAD